MKRVRNPPAGLPPINWSEMASRLLRPNRPRFDEVMAAVLRVAKERCPPSCRRGKAADVVAALTSYQTIAEAWEVVAPPEWIGDTSRIFLPLGIVPQRWHYEVRPRPGGVRADPTSLELAAALASDPEGVVAAEHLAREYAARLRPWRLDEERRAGYGLNTEIVWALMDPWWGGGNLPDLVFRVEYAARLAQEMYQWPLRYGPRWREEEPDARPREPEWWGQTNTFDPKRHMAGSEEAAARSGLKKIPHGESNYPQGAALNRMLSHLWDCRMWQEVAARGLQVPSSQHKVVIPAGLIGRRFDELPNPYEPLLGLLDRGYALLDIDGDAIFLGAPWEGKPISGPTWQSLGIVGPLREIGLRRARP